MTFGEVLHFSKLGRAFRLPNWQTDVNIKVKIPSPGEEMTAPYLYVTSRFGTVPWIPTQIEIFSEMWELVK